MEFDAAPWRASATRLASPCHLHGRWTSSIACRPWLRVSCRISNLEYSGRCPRRCRKLSRSAAAFGCSQYALNRSSHRARDRSLPPLLGENVFSDLSRRISLQFFLHRVVAIAPLLTHRLSMLLCLILKLKHIWRPCFEHQPKVKATSARGGGGARGSTPGPGRYEGQGSKKHFQRFSMQRQGEGI